MKRLIKLMSVALCLTLALSTSLVGVFALSLNGVSIGSADKATPDEADVFKEESVYVMAKADGTVDKIIVSDWIKNNKGADTITDVSTVGDIENVKTDASFTLNSDNMRVWQADGKDLYLEGTGEQPLPVDLALTYTLDGKVVSPEDIAGKSGKVTIRFDYTNNEYRKKTVNGKEDRFYVPFMMMSGMILDGEKFSHVEVTNGKVVSDGDRIILAGIAFPGLQHDLGLKKEEVNIPDYFEVTADAKDFELGTTVTICTNSLLNDLDADELDDLDKLEDKLGQLEDGMAALVDGSSQLYTGLQTLLDKSGELTQGVDALYTGAQQLSEGAAQVDEGAGTLSEGVGTLNLGAVTLDSGALNLSSGLQTLDANSAALNSGSDQTFEAILMTADKALASEGLDVPKLTPSNYADVLDGLLKQFSDENVKTQAETVAREKVTAAVEENREAVKAAVTEAVRQSIIPKVTEGVRQQVTAQVVAAAGYSIEDYDAAVAAGMVDETIQAQINGAVEMQMSSDAIQETINALTEENLQGDEAQAAVAQNTEAQIQSLIDQKMQSEEVQNGVNEALGKAAAARESIQALKDQLDSYNTFNTGLKAYTGGVSSASSGAVQLYGGATRLKAGSAALKDGAATLKGGTEQLDEGVKQLADGVLTLKNGVPALTEGVSALRDGSMQLSDGLKQFNEEGISKITDLLKNDVGDLAARLKATIEVSKEYKSYSGLADGMDGEVKFIYKTEEIQ